MPFKTFRGFNDSIRQEKLKNFNVLIDGLFQSRLAFAAEDSQSMILLINIIEKIDKVFIWTKRPDGSMEFVIQSIFIRFIILGFRLLETRLQLAHPVKIQRFGIISENIRFNDHANLKNIADFSIPNALYHDAALWNYLDKIFLLKPAYRLSYRCSAYPQLLHKITVAEETSRQKNAFDDISFNRLVR